MNILIDTNIVLPLEPGSHFDIEINTIYQIVLGMFFVSIRQLDMISVEIITKKGQN